QNIRKFVKDGFIINKLPKIHSRSHARRMKEAKRKGRHSGYGIFLAFLFVFLQPVTTSFWPHQFVLEKATSDDQKEKKQEFESATASSGLFLCKIGFGPVTSKQLRGAVCLCLPFSNLKLY
ncbi:60S ribosomal protein L19-1-like protein, partial [Tanacetum coccineum]